MKKKTSPLALETARFEARVAEIPTHHNRIDALPPSLAPYVHECVQLTEAVAHPHVIELIRLMRSYFLNDLPKAHPLRRIYSVRAMASPHAVLRRLLTKRPLAFYGGDDAWMLDKKRRGSGGWEHVGSEAEEKPLLARDYLSYDEACVSALVNLCGPTVFINDGARDNSGRKGRPGTFERRGVIMGAVGARLEKHRVMEYAHLVVDPRQNTVANGYGPSGGDGDARKRMAMWTRFYGHKGGYFPLHRNFQPGTRYVRVPGNRYFDKKGYAKRMAMALEPIFDRAIAHAKRIGKRAWVRLTGLGLGVWVLDKKLQAGIIVQTAGAIVRKRDPRATSIAAVEFLWYAETETEKRKLATLFGAAKWRKGTVAFTKTEPSAPLPHPESAFLFTTFAWDGLSFVGNEYWDDALDASGDPAAACSCIMPQTMNPRINVLLAKKDVHVTS